MQKPWGIYNSLKTSTNDLHWKSPLKVKFISWQLIVVFDINCALFSRLILRLLIQSFVRLKHWMPQTRFQIFFRGWMLQKSFLMLCCQNVSNLRPLVRNWGAEKVLQNLATLLWSVANYLMQLSYAIPVWGGFTSYDSLKPLLFLHKRALRNLFCIRWVSKHIPGHTKSVFNDVKILTWSMYEIFNYMTLLHLAKLITFHQPDVLGDLLKLDNCENRQYKTFQASASTQSEQLSE